VARKLPFNPKIRAPKRSREGEATSHVTAKASTHVGTYGMRERGKA
jgi:hypothetical protein